MTINQYLRNIQKIDGEEGVEEVKRIYEDVKSDFHLVGIKDGAYLNRISVIRTQAIYGGLVDGRIFDDKELRTAKRLENFSKKYTYEFIDAFIKHEIDYDELKERIKDYKKHDEKYLKQKY